ncbi:MAG: PTS transporter subunit EIIC [Olegusella sp.]|nr:PTS transporter subunit EIIC [Olegusella sp.]
MKDSKYHSMSETVLAAMGGKENISHVEHCATRLRLHYVDGSKIDEEAIKNAENVIGVVKTAEQIQVVIGPKVEDAYNEFLEVSGINPNNSEDTKPASNKSTATKGAVDLVTRFGNISAAVFMPIIPALITGGMILAFKNLLVNYFGFGTDSGTAIVLSAIYSAGLSFIPIYLGYSLASNLKMKPVMGALLGAVLLNSAINGVDNLDFLGISIPTVDYSGTVLPIILGVIFMYYVDKLLRKFIPDIIDIFARPILTMLIVVPCTLIVFGPLGSLLGYALSDGVTWLMDNVAFIATPILSVLNPYFVMLGLDKAYIAVDIASIAELGWTPIIFGFISNLAVGATTLALATSTHNDKTKRGMYISTGVTALCGVTEPAFYGALIERPRLLIGTAAGCASAGLIAGIFALKEYVEGACPGLLSALIFIAPDGGMGNFILACVVAAVSISVSFIVTKILIAKTDIKSTERA